MNITTKDTIGYIQRSIVEGKEKFTWIEAKVQKINIGKTKISVYTDIFYALNFDEIQSNTTTMMRGCGLIVVNSPFITNPTLTAKCKKVVEHWNEHGAIGLFD